MALRGDRRDPVGDRSSSGPVSASCQRSYPTVFKMSLRGKLGEGHTQVIISYNCM